MAWPVGVLLSIKDVVKIYGNGTRALDGVSLDVRKGEIFGLLGPNGAGKTTLSSIIASLHPITAGQVLTENGSIYDNIVSYRHSIGLCPQKPNIDLMLTMAENLEFAGRYYGLSALRIRERILYLSKQFGLEKFLDKRAYMLSGGYRQRFVIARALMHSPQLVILDEPTVGLDPHIRLQLWDFIKSLKAEGVTVLLTTHYLDEAEVLSDRVCILNRGKIELIDTPANLKKSYGKTNLEEVFVQMMNEEAK